MKRLRRIALGVLGAGALLLALGAGIFVWSGVYDISATDQHTAPVYWLIEATVQRSVSVRAREAETPELNTPQRLERGLRIYHANCLQCHGAPGVSPQRAVLGMTPVPAYLVPTGREWSAAKLQWVVKNGLKMTGMPAWRYRLDDEEIWDVVAFLKLRLPYLSAEQYRTFTANLAADKPAPDRKPVAVAGGDAEAGRRAIEQYACATCHVIPGVTGAMRHVGPPLSGIASRTFIGGVLANTNENMVRWLMSPQSAAPNTAMPDLGVREQDARDIAAYLAILSAR